MGFWDVKSVPKFPWVIMEPFVTGAWLAASLNDERYSERQEAVICGTFRFSGFG